MAAGGLPKGMTMIELMLVFAVVGVALAAGLQVYSDWQRELYVEQVRANITTLFQAMTAYYKAQCSGALTTAFTASSTAPVPVTLTTNSLLPYLPNKWESITPLTSGYILQFNPTVLTDTVTVNTCVVQTPGTTACTSTQSTIPTAPSTTTPQAQIVVWNAQVAILPSDPGTESALQRELGATCVSNQVGSIVTPCTQTTGSGPYLVLQALPTATTDAGGRGYWLSMPWVKQFQLQYTHDQMYELTPGTTDNSGNITRNYMCGT